MTLQEAIRSGKKFRRPCFKNDRWLSWPPGNIDATFFSKSTNCDLAFIASREDILADDWELEESSVQVTRATVVNAWKRAIQKDFNVLPYGAPNLSGLLKELGLE